MTINKLTLPSKSNAIQEKINEIIDNFPSGTTVDQTFDGTSANAQSGVAINGELASNYQAKLVSGTNIKTINNTSLLGSGDISVPTSISDLTDDTSTYPIDKAESVVDNNSGSLTFWSGTKAEYDAIATKDANTLYNVEDTTSPIISILDSLYPVGSIYIGTMSACPLQTLGVGTWQLVAQNRVLQGVGTGQTLGDTVEAGLPNITGACSSQIVTNSSGSVITTLSNTTGAFYANDTLTTRPYFTSGGTATGTFATGMSMDASRSSSIYGNSSTVQPPAYLVNIWERIS